MPHPQSLYQARIELEGCTDTGALISYVVASRYPCHSLVVADPRWSGQNRELQGERFLSDTSRPLFSMYLRISQEEEEKRAQRLKGDTDQLLVFVSPYTYNGHFTPWDDSNSLKP